MKRIFFASSDPGGANVIAATIRRLPERVSYRLFTDPQGHRVPALADRYEMIQPVDVRELIAAECPDIVFTGTSLTSALELHFLREGAARGSRTAAVIDHWTNFSRRFQWPDGTLQLPDLVLVPDQVAFSRAAAEGLPADRLRIFGHPHFADAATFISHVAREDFWHGAGVEPSSKIVLFLSDALTETAGDEARAKGQFGYTEMSILAHLIDALSVHPDVSLVIRPHPKERTAKFETFLQPRRVTLAPSAPLWDTIAQSDHVVGMFSSALVEAAAVGKLALRVEIGAGERDLLPIPREAYFERVLEEGQLARALDRLLAVPASRNRTNFLGREFESVLPSLLV